jgi:hypothetical protein
MTGEHGSSTLWPTQLISSPRGVARSAQGVANYFFSSTDSLSWICAFWVISSPQMMLSPHWLSSLQMILSFIYEPCFRSNRISEPSQSIAQTNPQYEDNFRNQVSTPRHWRVSRTIHNLDEVQTKFRTKRMVKAAFQKFFSSWKRLWVWKRSFLTRTQSALQSALVLITGTRPSARPVQKTFRHSAGEHPSVSIAYSTSEIVMRKMIHTKAAIVGKISFSGLYYEIVLTNTTSLRKLNRIYDYLLAIAVRTRTVNVMPCQKAYFVECLIGQSQSHEHVQNRSICERHEIIISARQYWGSVVAARFGSTFSRRVLDRSMHRNL